MLIKDTQSLLCDTVITIVAEIPAGMQSVLGPSF